MSMATRVRLALDGRLRPGGQLTEARWGIAGTGAIARQFAADLEHVRNGSLVAVGSRSLERASAFARQHDVPHAHGSYEALFADAHVDAIYVATPHSHHLTHAQGALAEGKAVLCEKPLTPTLDEAQTLIEAAKEADRLLVEGLWTYFLPATQQALAWVEEGRIGELRHVRCDFGYPQRFDPRSRLYDPALAGGALLDLGIYPIAMAWRALPQEPDAVHVVARTAPPGVDDDVVMVFDYPDAVATLGASFRCKLPNALHLVGTEGTVVVPDHWRAPSCARFELDALVESMTDPRQSIGLCFEAEAFGEDLMAGRRESRVVPWSTSLAFQRLLQRVRVAADLDASRA